MPRKMTSSLQIVSVNQYIDDQQCADNRRNADENEQSTDGLSHVVDDQQAV